jgi:Spy/CpxP family protein refolding chaperone
MHPGFIHHWRRRQRAAAECGTPVYGCYVGTRPGYGSRWAWEASRRFGDGMHGAVGFGARRPVRFLAMRLDLDDAQVAKLAKIVERLRVEREQAAVDSRRAAGALADALEGAAVDAARVEEATRLRVDATRRVQESVARALGELHELLDGEQREELASLIRSGAIQL